MKPHPMAVFGRLDVLSRSLIEIAERTWGVKGIEAPFIALKDLSLGDLGTDFPLRVAASIRKSATEISETLVTSFSDQQLNLKTYEGFINVQLGSAQSYINPKLINELPIKRFDNAVFILAPRSSKESISGMLRRAALIGLQSNFLSNYCSNISIIDHEGAVLPNPISAASHYWEHASKLSKLSPLGRKDVSQLVEKVILSRKAELTFVWSAEELWSQKLYRELQNHTELVTQFASTTWLEEWGSETERETILARVKDFPLDGLYVLSDFIRGSDLDGTVIGIRERTNLNWYLQATKERLSQLVPEGIDKDDAKIFDGVFSRKVGVRASFLEDFRRRAAWRGQVWDYLVVLADFLDSTHRVLNEPRLRQAISQGDYSSVELHSLALAKHVLQIY